jgi:predicted MPP superfamily phosphohydrolase
LSPKEERELWWRKNVESGPLDRYFKHNNNRREEPPSMTLKNSILFFMVCALLFAGVPDPSHSSETRQDLKPVKYREYIFTDWPSMKADGPGLQLTLVFHTRIPTLPSSIHAGFMFPSEKLAYPSFGKTFIEEKPAAGGAVNDHQVRLDLARMHRQLDNEELKKKGLDIYYLIELWNPEKQSVEYYQGKQRMRNEGGRLKLLPTVVEGPFVNLVTCNSAVISWYTDVPTGGEVLLSAKQHRDDIVRRRHEIRLTSLNPNSIYDYTVKIIDDKESYALPSYSFRTAPHPGSPQKFRFVFMSDSRAGAGGGIEDFAGFNKPALKQFFLDAHAHLSDFIIFGGDLIDGYCSEAKDIKSYFHQWKTAVEPVGHYVPIYTAIGNHEFVGDVYQAERNEKKVEFFCDRTGDDSLEAIFAHEFVNPDSDYPQPETRNGKKGPDYRETVYSFDYANTHFSVLNSDYWYSGITSSFDRALTAEALKILGGNRAGYLMTNQLTWLEKDLKAARERKMEHLLVILHEPPFPNGGHSDSSMFWGRKENGHWSGLNDPAQPLGDVTAMRNRFLGIVSHYNVLALFCGHEHNYSRLLMDSSVDKTITRPAWQIISGGGGAPYYFNQEKDLPWSHNVKSFTAEQQYCLIEIDGKKVTYTVYSPTGEVLDEINDMGKELPAGNLPPLH